MAAWTRAELRRRWRSIAVLGVLIGVTAGFATAAFVGAQRSDDALDRLRHETNASDAIVFASQSGYVDADWDRLRAVPGVEAVAVWDLLFGFSATAPESLLFAADDDTWLGTVNRPIVVEGRMWDPAAADEVVVSEALAKDFPVGSTFDFQPFSADQPDLSGEPQGPPTTMRIVGVVRTINQFLFAPGQVFLSPGYMAAHRDEVTTFPNADIRLQDAETDLPRVQDEIQTVIGEGTPVFDLNTVARRVETTTSVESAALLLLAAAIAVAGGILVTQAVARSASSVEEDAPTLRAMGMSSGDISAAAIAAHLPAVVVAAVATVATAVGTSALFPVGLARRIEPDGGVHAAWSVIVPATILTVAVSLVGVWAISHRAATHRYRRASRGAPGFVRLLRRSAPVPVALGTSMAFDAGSGARRLPVRPALVAAVVGVVGVVATMTIDRGIQDVVSHPERAGVVYDLAATPYEPIDGAMPDAFVADVLAASGPGARASEMMRTVTAIADVGQQALAVAPVGADTEAAVQLTYTEGRAPREHGEVAIGPKVARDTGLDLGDETTVVGIDGPVRVVGIALFPPEVHVGFDEGIAVTVDDFTSIVDEIASQERAEEIGGFAEHWLAVSLPDGADVETTTTEVQAAVGDVASVSVPDTPIELVNLRNVRTLPFLLAGFLSALAIASMVHVYTSSIRRRRHDFAVLRALGLASGASRLVLNAQGTSIAAAGLVVGLPLGTVIGRYGWRYVSGRVPLAYEPPFALVAVVLSVPLALLVVNALAVWPGQLVARMRIADELRTE
jgi:ABC-type lipoprotein release transport system permease subunit